MACKETTNCSKFPGYPCYDTEKECQCKCPDGGLDPDSDECKCIDTEVECVGGRVRKTDCKCFCGAEKYLEDGVCVRYQYSCDGQTCFKVRGAGQYLNWGDCGLNCPPGGGGPPPCFPVPTAPPGEPLLCPDGSQYGLITYIYNPIQCRYSPIEFIWRSCSTPPPQPSTTSSSGPDPGDSSSGPECDCEAGFSGVSNTSATVCGQTVPTTVVTPFCNGGFRIFEWCEECGCANKPTLKQQQLYVFREKDPYTGELLCAFEYIPLPPNLGGPFPCPAACPESSSSVSTSSGSQSSESQSSSPCEVTTATSINFSGSTQTGTPLNDFREDDYAEVVIYSPTGLQNARDTETKWTFYVVYPNPNTNPPNGSTRYNITDGDFSGDEWPSFILTSEMLLDVLGLNFGTAPNGAYPFQLCAEAINCAGIYDTRCATNGIVVKVTENTPTSSSSSTAGNSSSSSSPVASSSSSPRSCSPGGPNSSRVLYFVGGGCPGGTAEWSRLQNWREIAADSNFPPVGSLCDECIPTSLPDATDTVILRYSVTAYSATDNTTVPEVRRVIGLNTSTEHGLFIPVLANTAAEFAGLFYIGRDPTTTPPRVGAIESPSGVVKFTGGASNNGLVKGTAEFFGYTINNTEGTITCGATFNDNSRRVDADRISGTIVCNTAGLPCSTTSNSTPPAFCPSLPAPGLVAAGALAPKCGMRYVAVAYTNELPDDCAYPPAGWIKQGRRLLKTTEEVDDILECQFKLWDLKNEVGLFHDGTYRVSTQCRAGAWYAVPVKFGYMLLGYKNENGNCELDFAHILAEQILQED